MDLQRYVISDVESIYTPALVFYRDLIQANIERVIAIAGKPTRLRPHAKTHKTREITEMELAAGISKHKCATLAEAEVLASAGAKDVLIAYPIIGPNIRRLIKLMQRFPDTRFAVLVDHPAACKRLSEGMEEAGLRVDALLDLNVGQNRTGIIPGPAALELYRQIAASKGLRPDGFHVYDGHNHQETFADREAIVRQLLEPVLVMRNNLEKEGFSVPRLVCGGTPSFTVYAKLDLPGIECSPGTFVLYDQGYGSKYADLSGFVPAAALVTRVISRPTSTRVTMDLGYKAVASDPPAGKRVTLLGIPEYTAVLQNEEHLVIETPHADQLQPGDVIYAIPTHICPTCSMHEKAYVVEKGKLIGEWRIAARDRVLTI